jgi:hypothetical protein
MMIYQEKIAPPLPPLTTEQRCLVEHPTNPLDELVVDHASRVLSDFEDAGDALLGENHPS